VHFDEFRDASTIPDLTKYPFVSLTSVKTWAPAPESSAYFLVTVLVYSVRLSVSLTYSCRLRNLISKAATHSATRTVFLTAKWSSLILWRNKFSCCRKLMPPTLYSMQSFTTIYAACSCSHSLPHGFSESTSLVYTATKLCSSTRSVVWSRIRKYNCLAICTLNCTGYINLVACYGAIIIS
jgi:hypothetical protein